MADLFGDNLAFTEYIGTHVGEPGVTEDVVSAAMLQDKRAVDLPRKESDDHTVVAGGEHVSTMEHGKK